MKVSAPPSGDISDDDALRNLFATQPQGAIEQQTVERKISGNTVKHVSIAASYGVLFAFISVFTRQVTDAGVAAFQVVFIQEGGALLMALGLVLWAKTHLRPASWRVLGLLVLQGVGKYVAFGCVVFAITFLPPANVSAINKSTLPLFIGIGACIFLRLKPSVAACIGGTFCTTGVVLVAIGSWKNIGTSRGNSAPITGNLGTSRDISAPITGNISTSRDNSEPIIGVSLAILSALIESLLNVQVRILLRDCTIVMVLFYTFAVSFAIGTVPMLIMRPQWSMDVHITTLLVLCAGLYAVTSFIYVKAAKTVPPVTQVVLSQLELGVTFLLQFAFLRFVPNVFEIGGALVIAVGGLVDSVFIVRVDSRNRKKLDFRKQLGFNVDSDDAKSHTVDWKDRLREGNRQK